MASGPTLPPQAYTREILTSAFNWLQTQPESVKKLAVTPDALVGLFMRAQRFGNSSLEADAPVSSQSFMSDLKNLAEGLKQFEDPKERRGPAPSATHQAGFMSSSNSSTSQSHSAGFMTTNQEPPMQAPSAQNTYMPTMPTPPMPPQHVSFPQNYAPVASPSPVMNPMTNVGFAAPLIQSSLNERSLQMIQEVKHHFNLTTEAETINMMVSIAYKNLKDLLA